MRHIIKSVYRGSVAERAGIQAGDILLKLNGESIEDEIDYQALIVKKELCLELERNQLPITLHIHKSEGAPLGLQFGESMLLSPRSCRNHCEFCFIEQMPKGLRETLYVKDDDWRFSLMMGNYVTLTNVDEAEMQRIIHRRVSPLYISVHTTNPTLRCEMMQNRFAGDILSRLTRFKEAGLHFHCQIVLCPGRNDGVELERTLRDLMSLYPAALTVALVPVGLTRFRQGLKSITPYTAQKAEALLEQIAALQEECLNCFGTRFVFPSDEFFCLAGKEIPSEEWYEDYPQIENGVGLLRKLEAEAEEIAGYEQDAFGSEKRMQPRRYLIATGMSAAPFIERLAARYCPMGSTVRVIPVINHFFGETVTVAGLLTGQDVLHAVQQEDLNQYDELLLSASMLRHERDRFLDDMSVEEFKTQLPIAVRFIENDGDSFYYALQGN